jgi:uncharacterized membrane protein
MSIVFINSLSNSSFLSSSRKKTPAFSGVINCGANVKGMQGLGTLGGSFSQAWDISADGTKVVGKSYKGSYTEALYWNKAQGIRSLKSLLVKDYGLDLTGWTLVEAKGISADGLTIVGWGINPHGLEEGWFVRLIATR